MVGGEERDGTRARFAPDTGDSRASDLKDGTKKAAAVCRGTQQQHELPKAGEAAGLCANTVMECGWVIGEMA